MKRDHCGKLRYWDWRGKETFVQNLVPYLCHHMQTNPDSAVEIHWIVSKGHNRRCNRQNVHNSIRLFDVRQVLRMPEEKKKEEPIYERLEPKECLIISKSEKELLVACNEDGEVKVKRVQLPPKEE